MKKRWSTGKIVAAIFGGVAAVILLWVSLVISIIQLGNFLSEDKYTVFSEVTVTEEGDKDSREKDSHSGHDSAREYQRGRSDEENNEKEWDDAGQDEYYEFADALQDNLFYKVTFEDYERDDFQTEEGQGEASVEFIYPVVSGDVTNLEGINDAIQKELEIVTDHVASIVDYLEEDETYLFIGDAYVTYMTEELLSIAYVEYGYLDDDYLESYVVSVNVDMETGMVLDNTQLLRFDDSFSIDFRERCERQNGEIDSLSYMSDQEITSYLLDSDYLIALYTPLGMEIGFNFYDGWVTVTYKDYERYQKQF